MTSHDRNEIAPLASATLEGWTLHDAGAGRPILVLHGGGGAPTVAGLSQTLSGAARVLTPTHPGFDGTPCPAWLRSVAGLAKLYLTLLERMGIDEIVVVGSSMGGWISSEMALQEPRRIKGLILINAVGIAVEDHSLVDVSQLTPPELVRLVFHDPAKMLAGTPQPSAQQQAIRVSNAAALAAYDDGMNTQDPSLRARLSDVTMPVLVLWGESDGIASPRYGAAYADAFTNSVFELIPQAGHLPHIEQEERVSALIGGFLRRLGWAS
jgi:pimeloyl-ACP methyl ester carboxylesterase